MITVLVDDIGLPIQIKESWVYRRWTAQSEQVTEFEVEIEWSEEPKP